MKSIKRQIVLLVCFVFALALCGAVAAEDPQRNALDNNTTLENTPDSSYDNSLPGLDPRIYGVIKENNTPVNGATITIKDPNTNETIATGTTDSTGQYNINFISNQNIFKVEITYKNYKIYVAMVECTGTPPTAELNHTFIPSKMLKPTKLTLIVDGYIRNPTNLLKDVYKELYEDGYDFELRIFNLQDIYFNPGNIVPKLAEELKTTNILAVLITGGGSYALTSNHIEKAVESLPTDASIYGNNINFKGRNVTPFGFDVSMIFGSYLNRENIKRIYLDLLRKSNAINISANDTKIINQTQTSFLYHPDTRTEFTSRDDYLQWYIANGKYKTNAPWIGIILEPWVYYDNDMRMYNTLISTLERKGANVIAMIPSDLSSTKLKDYFFSNDTPAIDVIIYTLPGYAGINLNLTLFKEHNVPIVTPLVVYSITLDEYLQNGTGLFGFDLNARVTIPEIDGRILPILIGGVQVLGKDYLTNMELKALVPYQPGIDQLANQVIAWANLKHKNNSEKKIALVYADNTHDEDMPIAEGLNLPKSLSNIIKALTAAGYNFGSFGNISDTELLSLINDRGRNLRNYTQEDLLNLIQKGAITITNEEYLQWYSELPSSLKAQVEAVWGPPPGDVMVYEDKIVIPGIILGNVFLGPQPIWKWNGTLNSLFNNETLPPTHQYIAFYFWLQKRFHADAYVQVGDHGTLELLPGHTVGMTADDWPNILIGYMPHIYIKIMAGKDASDAKRRAYAVIITHLIPPVSQTELYGNLRELQELISAYRDAYTRNDSERMAALEIQVLNKIKDELGLSERLGITSTTNFEVVLNNLEDYLDSIMSQITTYGLHTFGDLPDDETLEKFIETIIAFDPANRTSRYNEIRDLLVQSASNEMKALLNALSGGYIPSGLAGDPVRSLDTLPTGRNKYTFDPRRVPDAAAMTIGAKSINELLKRYAEASGGKYPETVGIPVCGGEVLLTYGQSIASIFNLIGVKPIYKSGMVVDIEVIPLSELGRPRIDVLIQGTPSFLYACPEVVRLVDEAIKKVALLDEPPEMNYIRKHYLAMLPLLEANLREQGKSTDDAKDFAGLLASSRIFGLPPGADPHGVGVGRILYSSNTWTEEEIADLYLNYNSYIYGSGISGISGRSVIEKLLLTVDTTMFVDPFIISDTRRYFLSAVINNIVKQVSDKQITSYIIKTGDNKPKAKTIQESMYDDLILTLFNPSWKDALMKEGDSGHNTIALRIRSVFTNDALVHVLNNDIWRRIVKEYIFDQNFYSQLNPSAAKMIANVIYQANQRGMMQLTSEEVRILAEIMGISGSEQPTQSQTGTENQPPGTPGTLGAPGVPSAPGTPAVPGSTPGYTGTPGTAGEARTVGAAGAAAAGAGPGSSDGVYEVSKAGGMTGGAGNLPIYAIAGIITLVALVGAGYFLAGRKGI